MKRMLTIAAISLVAITGWARPNFDITVLQVKVAQVQALQLLNWEVGQENEHNISLMGMTGTMHSVVTQETDVGYWLTQDVSVGGMDQKMEIHFNKDDASIIEMKVNGKKQDPPAAPNVEVEEMKDDKVTVPAGAFDCMFVQIRNVDNDERTKLWVNQQLIPIDGMLKMETKTQGMDVSVELVRFKK